MHVAIIGMTGTGKTHLAKTFCAAFKNSGRGTLVLDPMYEDGWECDDKTGDFGEFWYLVWENKNCAVFVEEAGQTMNRHDFNADRLATQTRHRGHVMHFMAQRGAQLSPTVRGQCTEFYIFRSRKADCKVYADDFDRPEIMEAAQLPNRVCLYYNSETRELRKIDLN
jgi:hypothetical protein